MKKLFFILELTILLPLGLYAQKTEVHYLSGTGCDHTVDWQFFCTGGRNSGKWTTIPVPSNWELQGFGTYNYGNNNHVERGKEKGLYKYEFKVPDNWKNKQVDIVFEGSMTDTEVKINGKPAGTVHQGAFYCFRYDISRFLKYGKENLLEATVSKESSNESVNKAERHGDFWIFGGIYRPVYLEAKPRQNIGQVAIDAKADGTFSSEVMLSQAVRADSVAVQVTNLKGEKAGKSFSAPVVRDNPDVFVQSKLGDIKTWTPEDPNLYRATFRLYNDGKIVHEVTRRFGFRTIEIRQRDGIYVNGVKIKFKGINHHVFRPETGRALCKAMSIADVKLIKSMNMNAVRCSHYPPDGHFLDACDSLGLFVLDELTGWHHAYDTEVGSKLVREMIEHDRNHPSIIIWDNGNEGGHNYELDPLFAKYDLQKRLVIHPWQAFNGTSTEHYINYDYGMGTYWHGHDIVFPTEFLHGLYDGGAGAGLYDYWELMWHNPRAAGGFIWVFADEGVVRTDRDNQIDTDGDHAPDGILGPFHEKEGSYYAVKEIWSPVRFEEKDITRGFDGSLNVENRYFYTNLKDCSFSWKLARVPLPGENSSLLKDVASGSAKAPDIAPGDHGQLKLSLPDNWFTYDILYVTAVDKHHQEIYTWSWPISLPDRVVGEMLLKKGDTPATILEQNDSVIGIAANSVRLSIGKHDGLLKKVTNAYGEIPFSNGPVLCAGDAVFKEMKVETVADTVRLTCSYEKESKMKELIWSVYPSGWVHLNIKYNPVDYESDYMGVSFSYPEKLVKGIRWMGNGPYRVWKNRKQGAELNVWQKDYNNTITGVSPLIYPEFKGYYSGFYWAKMQTEGQPFVMATSSEDVFLRLYTPATPEKPYNTAPPFPAGDISFMQGIPAIGTKSQKAENLGPSGKKNMYFDYGPYDDWHIRCKVMDLYFNFKEEPADH